VSLIAENGKIYTPGGSNDTLDVAITGSSDGTTGVDLPGVDVGPPEVKGKAAIVIISKEQELKIGENAVLTAKGTYYWQDETHDDRPSIWFLSPPPPPETVKTGNPIDVAIYLGSYNYDSTTSGGNATVNCSVDMADNGTMVIDAWDTVNIGDEFEASEPWSNGKANGLEVVSRMSGDSFEEVILNHRLPYALEARGHRAPPWFEDARGGIDTYVLRGKVVLAEVLASVGAVPLPPPVDFKLKERREVNEPDKEALEQSLKDEIGEDNARIYLARAYKPSLNTDLFPYKAAKELTQLKGILKDEGGLRVAALVEIVTKSVEKGLAAEEQTRVIETELKQNEPAKEWLDALAKYVRILNTEIGLPADRSVDVAMKNYGQDLRPGGEQQIAEWVKKYVKPAGG